MGGGADLVEEADADLGVDLGGVEPGVAELLLDEATERSEIDRSDSDVPRKGCDRGGASNVGPVFDHEGGAGGGRSRVCQGRRR